MVVGPAQNGVGDSLVLGGGTGGSFPHAFSARLDWACRVGPAASLRQLSFACSVLAAHGHCGRTDHGEADPLQDAQRILGEALEPWVPLVGLRSDLPAIAQAYRRCRGKL